jgi:alkyl sulfatase BDS1-like metallo-beta-lactamase superfamily hydrolase
VVHNIWRLYGGWWDGAPSRLKPSPDAQLGAVIAELSGGVHALVARALHELALGDFRMACHLIDFAAWAEPDNGQVHEARSDIYERRRSNELSLMSKGIFKAAARESRAVIRRSQEPKP